ncbi:MAG TPA: PepSY-associated TM helix domain-containing protein, partial [Gemmatirosa sp.]|nr:PepSY-associated TM helix domain-containing protein [Gemmatirosa sp.]
MPVPARLRSILFWAHLTTGVVVGLVVLVMSVTGVLLAYQKQIQTWADARVVQAVPGVAHLPIDTLVARAAAAVRRLPADAHAMPGHPPAPSAITLRSAHPAAAEVAFGRERTVFVHTASGAVLGEGATRVRRFFRTVTDVHRWLAASGPRRELGKSVTGVANLGFLLLVTSGLSLWWPRRWTSETVRAVATFRRGLRGKARDFNWHHVIGIWSLVPLFVVVLSGVVISYGWASDLVFRVAGEAPPPRTPEGGEARGGAPRGGPSDERPETASLDAIVARAQSRMVDWRIVTVTLPKAADTAFTVAVDRGTGGQPQHRAQITFARATGAELSWKPFA